MIINILLTAVVVFLAVIAVLLYRGPRMHVEVNAEFAIEQLKQAADHYADVLAVVEMMRQLGELDEDALAKLQSYPEQVRAAALLHFIDTLGSALRDKQTAYAEAVKVRGATHPITVSYNSQVGIIRNQLDEAVKMAGSVTLRAV